MNDMVTAQELHVEAFFPADPGTGDRWAAMAGEPEEPAPAHR